MENNNTVEIRMPSADVEDLHRQLAAYGQEHVLKFWPRLSGEQKSQLVSDIQAVDFKGLTAAFKETLTNQENNNQKLDLLLEPIPQELHEGVSRCTAKQLDNYLDCGLREISEGRVAALLLAGGQGTRLGVNYPKGMYDVGLPSGKTLYQLQGERLLKLEEMAEKFTGKRGTIPWYIMTSEHTMDPTIEFFSSHNYFGLQKENLIVFEQFMQPCLTLDGKVILESPYRIAKAPDGNGGLFRALRQQGILEDMTKRGISYVHVYCVDNILVKMADPVFIGYCISKGADCAAKVVQKVIPTEAVGVVCRVGGKFQVVEYSEISLTSAEKRNSDGKLTFNAGNICNHFFTVNFLHQIGSGDKKLKYHIAQKKIPYVGDDEKIVKPIKPNGLKLEKFVFDVFEFSNKFAAWEVCRDEEFSPLKNSDDCAKDTPTTARNSLYALHKKYIKKAGGKIIEDNFVSEDPLEKKAVGICEISPLVSYAGEDLVELVQNKSFTYPVIISGLDEQLPIEVKC